MRIELSKEVEKYNETVFAGLNLNQTIFSLLALAAGTACYLIFNMLLKLPSMVCVYLVLPVVTPIGLCGFYQKNNMYLLQLIKHKAALKKMPKILLYKSTECPEVFEQFKIQQAGENESLVPSMKKTIKRVILIGSFAVVLFLLFVIFIIYSKLS